MILKVRLPLVALFLSLGFIGCSDDKKKPEETIEAQATETPAPPPEEATPAPVAETAALDWGSERVYFAFDDYSLSSDAQSTLNKVAEFLKGSASAVVQIEGHADERGSTEYNLALGERRAQSVKNYLVQLGVDAARLPTISYGEERPAVEGHDESSWSKNRRGQFAPTN